METVETETMIAKRILRDKATSSFERLGHYILNTKSAKNTPSMVRTFDYILREEGIDGRVGTVRFENCIADNLSLALKEIIATQALNTRAKSDRTYHLVASFAPGERPSPTQLEDIENELCTAIGLGQHQRISATHVDTAHLHLHCPPSAPMAQN